ncbi:MAG: hypothetical protein ACPG5B_00460 [Chitinophagales bacterium]
MSENLFKKIEDPDKELNPDVKDKVFGTYFLTNIVAKTAELFSASIIEVVIGFIKILDNSPHKSDDNDTNDNERPHQ